MYGVNKVTLIGNVGKDPETKYLENGLVITNFSLTTSERYKNKLGEKVTTTEWHNIVLKNGLAEIAEKYVKKGSPLFIEGKIVTRSWEDKEGRRRYITEIIGNNLIMLESRSASNSNNYGAQSISTDTHESLGIDDEMALDTESDDLPF